MICLRIFENGTCHDRSTVEEIDILAVFTAAMDAPTALKAVVTDQISKKACLNELSTMEGSKHFLWSV